MSMRALLALVAIVACNAAGAQETRTGTLVPGVYTSSMTDNLLPVDGRSKNASRARSKAADDNYARDTMRDYTTCIVSSANSGREHDALVSFLKVSPLSKAASTSAGRIKKPECLRFTGADYVQLRYTNDLIRGGIFRALYLEGRRSPSRRRVLPQEIAGTTTASDATFALMQRIGACVVAGHASDAELLLSANIGSADENAAVRSLAPALAGCLDKRMKAQFSRAVLEAMLSEALYNQSNAAFATATTEVVN